MPPTRVLARILGPAMIATAISETLNWHIFAESLPAVVILNGTILFVCGVAIVQSHSVWCMGPPVLVTAVGWITAGTGLYRMIFPEKVLSMVRDGQGPMYGVLGGVTLAGVALCCMGYG